MEKIIKVAMCDDMKYLCEIFKSGFLDYPEICFTGMSHNSHDCLEMLKNIECDVLLLDIRMESERAGIDIIPQIKELNSNIKIVMLTSFNNDDYVFAAFANGADDYCDKSQDIKNIVQKIKSVYNNIHSLSPEITKKLVKKTKEVNDNQKSLLFMFDKIASLTPGEFEILNEMYHGSDYKKIAARRCVEVDSVYRMASRMLKKFDTKNISDLIKELRRMKIFDFLSNK